MCLTSFPTQFQEIEDFNIDEYDSEYFESTEFGSDDAFFNDFIAGFMPAGTNAAAHFTVSEMPALPAAEAEKMFVPRPQEPLSAAMVSTAAPKKRPAALMSGAALLPVQVKVEGQHQPLQPLPQHMAGALMGKNRRMKKRRRRAFTTNDPRRGYVDLIFAAINTGDGLLALLQRITHPEVAMTTRFLGDPSSLFAGKLYREVKGREQIAKFMDTFLLASPDAVLRLHEKKMRLRQNNSSYVVAKYTLEGHKFCHVLTTNDKHVSKKALCPTKTVPAAAQTVQAVAAAAGVSLPSKTSSVGSTSQDESETSAQSLAFTAEEEWSDDFLDDISVSGSPFLLDSALLAFSAPSGSSFLSNEDIAAKSELLLQASQFPQRPLSISGAEQKVSVASQNTDFGLSNSLAVPAFMSSIGTMALHINANRQIYKIDFLWTFKKNEEAKGRK